MQTWPGCICESSKSRDDYFEGSRSSWRTSARARNIKPGKICVCAQCVCTASGQCRCISYYYCYLYGSEGHYWWHYRIARYYWLARNMPVLFVVFCFLEYSVWRLLGIECFYIFSNYKYQDILSGSLVAIKSVKYSRRNIFLSIVLFFSGHHLKVIAN